MHRDPADPSIVLHARLACPQCGAAVNAASQLGKRFVPDVSDGDYAVCMRCVRVNIYQISPVGQISLRAASPAEAEACEQGNPDTFARLRARIARRGRPQ